MFSQFLIYGQWPLINVQVFDFSSLFIAILKFQLVGS